MLCGVASGVMSPVACASAPADGYGQTTFREVSPSRHTHLRGHRFVEVHETPDAGPALAESGDGGGTATTVPDAGGTLTLLSLGLAAMAGIAWVRCRGEAVRR